MNCTVQWDVNIADSHEVYQETSIIFKAINEIRDDKSHPDKGSTHSNLLKKGLLCTEEDVKKQLRES